MDGKYGAGCQSVCGHCDNLTQCHHVDGTCLSGCLPGYRLEQCKERKYTINLTYIIQTGSVYPSQLIFLWCAHIEKYIYKSNYKQNED